MKEKKKRKRRKYKKKEKVKGYKHPNFFFSGEHGYREGPHKGTVRFTGAKPYNRYALLDPVTYEVVRTLDSLAKIEAYSGLKKLYGRLHLYENYKIQVEAKPTLFGYIVVRFNDDEVRGKSNDEIVEMLHQKAKGWMIATTMERIRQNFNKLDQDALDKLFKYLEKIDNYEKD